MLCPGQGSDGSGGSDASDVEDEDEFVYAWDALTGEELDGEEVAAARKEEMTFVKSLPVYEECDEDDIAEIKEALKELG